MKYFLIKYRFSFGSKEEWHGEISRFIAAVASDPELKGRIVYRCLKSADGEYFHFAGAADGQAVKLLQSRDFFTKYAADLKIVAGGAVDVIPLEVIAETDTQ